MSVKRAQTDVKEKRNQDRLALALCPGEFPSGFFLIRPASAVRSTTASAAQPRSATRDVAEFPLPMLFRGPNMSTKARLGLRLSLVLVLAVAGCSRSPHTAADLSGRVTLNNAPLPAGTITFHTKDGAAYACGIRSDGTYSYVQLPKGELAVTIETEPVNPDRKVEGESRKEGDVPAKYVKINLKYADKGTSGLSVTLKAGKQTKDFNLTD
jgi:hypothetical protein